MTYTRKYDYGHNFEVESIEAHGALREMWSGADCRGLHKERRVG